MGKVIFNVLVTLDGFFEGRNEEIDWDYFDEEHERRAIDLLSSVGRLIFGRKTYQLMADRRQDE
jgi:dihydrofolate reductase